MPTSRDLPVDRLAIGQLLVRLLRQFRAELFAPAAARGYPDLREPHLQIFGNLGVDGVRLTQLAARAQLSLAATSELVNDLQDLGYLERRPDRFADTCRTLQELLDKLPGERADP
jgi:DNA-binding MarR family transcriptional regulator